MRTGRSPSLECPHAGAPMGCWGSGQRGDGAGEGKRGPWHPLAINCSLSSPSVGLLERFPLPPEDAPFQLPRNSLPLGLVALEPSHTSPIWSSSFSRSNTPTSPTLVHKQRRTTHPRWCILLSSQGVPHPDTYSTGANWGWMAAPGRPQLHLKRISWWMLCRNDIAAQPDLSRQLEKQCLCFLGFFNVQSS